MSKIQVFKVDQKDLHKQALSIRFKVFVEEQSVDESIEIDHEDESTHFLLSYKKQPAGTARFRITDNGIKLERFAILSEFRGLGLGNDLLRFVLFHARDLNMKIYLNAQHQVVGYYEKWGFVKIGEPFFEANIQHYKMIYQPENLKEKALSKAICRR